MLILEDVPCDTNRDIRQLDSFHASAAAVAPYHSTNKYLGDTRHSCAVSQVNWKQMIVENVMDRQ